MENGIQKIPLNQIKEDKIKEKYKCKLFPYEIEETLCAQDAGDRPGWNITAFDMPKTWEKTKGEGIKIYVLDTGADLDHPDLKPNLIRGKNFINPKKDPWDKCGHGSHAAGIICAPKNGIGIIGVAPESKVAPIKVLDDSGNGNMVTVAEAVRWAADDGADIISMSLGSPNKIQQLRKAIQYATKKNVPIFCAAGNAGVSKHIFYPARYPETIAVGSINENFDRSDFSNTGENLDFMAPGNKILSCIPKNWYGILSGTSMACPFAVGATALLLSYIRNHKTNEKIESVNDVRNLLKKYTTPIKNKEYGGKKFFQGFGIIDPEKFSTWMKKNEKNNK